MNGRSGMKPSDALALSGSVARSWPFTRMRPEVGLSRPAIILSVVVLPAPLGPRKPWISPGATSRLTPSTAVNEPYVLTSPSTAIMPSGGLRPAVGGAVALGDRDLQRPQVARRTAHQDGRVAGLDRHLRD